MIQLIYFPIGVCNLKLLIWILILLTFILHVAIAWEISALRLVFYMSRIDAHLQRFVRQTPIRRYSRRLWRKLILEVVVFFIDLPLILFLVLHVISTAFTKPTSSSPFGPLLVISFSFIHVILAFDFDSISFSKIWTNIVSSLTYDFTTFHRWPKLGGISLLLFCIVLSLFPWIQSTRMIQQSSWHSIKCSLSTSQCLLLMKWPGFLVYIPILCFHIIFLLFLRFNCFVKIVCSSLSASVRLTSLASCIVHSVKMMENVVLSSPQMLFA